MDHDTTRRGVLASVGGVSASLLAGCASPSSTRGTTNVDGPSVPSTKLEENGWKRTAQRQRHVFDESYFGGAITVSADQHTVVYEDRRLRETVKKRTLGKLDTSLKLFFSTRVGIEPGLEDLPFGLGVSQVVDRASSSAKRSFERRLADAGLSDVSERRTTDLDIDTGETAKLVEYAAAYDYDAIPVPVPRSDDVVIPSGSLPVTGLLAVWRRGDDVLIAGGAFPAQDFEETVGTDVSEAIHVEVSIDLGLRPARYRQEVLNLVQSTE